MKNHNVFSTAIRQRKEMPDHSDYGPDVCSRRKMRSKSRKRLRLYMTAFLTGFLLLQNAPGLSSLILAEDLPAAEAQAAEAQAPGVQPPEAQAPEAQAPSDSSAVPDAAGGSSGPLLSDSSPSSGSISIRNEVYSLDDFADQPGTGQGGSSDNPSSGTPAAPDLSVDLSLTAENEEDRNAIDSSLEKQIAGQEGGGSGASISMDESDPDLCHLTLPAGESFTLDELPPGAKISLSGASSSDPEHFETDLTSTARGDGGNDAEGEGSGDTPASAQEKRTYTYTQTQKDHDRIVLICSAESVSGGPEGSSASGGSQEEGSAAASPASGSGQSDGNSPADGSSGAGPDFEYTVTSEDGSSFSYQTDHPDYRSGSAQNGTATFLLKNGQKALISQMTEGLLHIVQKAHEAYDTAAALLNQSAAEKVSIPEQAGDAGETAADVNCTPGAPTPYIRFTNIERKNTPEEEKPNPETDKADPEKETDPPQTEAPEKETEPPQTEAPVKETEPPQTEVPEKETEPPQTEAPPKETEPPQTEVPVKELFPPRPEGPEKEAEPPQTVNPGIETLTPQTEAPGKKARQPETEQVFLITIPEKAEPAQASPAPKAEETISPSGQEAQQPRSGEKLQNESPETGDDTPLLFWLSLLLLSSAAAFAAARRKGR